MPRSDASGSSPVSAQDTKQCPYCAETIKAAAVKCRYCHSDLTDVTAPPPVPETRVVDAGPSVAHPEATSPLSEPSAPAAPRRLGVGRSRTRAEQQPTPKAPRRGLSTTVLVVTLVPALLIALTFAGLALRDWRETNRLSDAVEAGKTVRAEVSGDLETLLTYKYTSFDEDFAAAKKVMTPSFQKDYAPTVDAIKERALSQKRTQKAHVDAVSVLSQTPDNVDALVFVDTVSTTQGSKKSQVLQNRVKVSFQKVDGKWLIDDLAVPQS